MLDNTQKILFEFWGTPRNKLSNIVGWASCPPYGLGRRDAHPTGVNWIFFIWKSLSK